MNIRKQTSARVHLAAGLPLTWVSEQKEDFKRYLLQRDSVNFTFRGVDYHVDFVGADIFPQGFAFGEYEAGRVIINEDICATAKGYEYLARLRAKKGGVV